MVVHMQMFQTGIALTATKRFLILYENDFLEDFLASYLNRSQDLDNGKNNRNIDSIQVDIQSNQQSDKNIQSANGSKGPEIIYQAYEPTNSTELREYMQFLICKKIKKLNKKQVKHYLGSGQIKGISNKLINYLTDSDSNRRKLLQKYNNDILIFDSVFESGNLLQAEMTSQSEYQLYMQVDTNTRGHQQWFYFRVRNTRANRKYCFKIMNFTKPGLVKQQTQNVNNQNNNNTDQMQQQQLNTGIGGVINLNTGGNYGGFLNNQRKQDHLQRIHYRTKNDEDWKQIDSDQLEFIKTNVQRKRKDILAAAADSDQEDQPEDQLEEVAGQNINSNKFLNKKTNKKRKPQYYYALKFEFQFENDNDSIKLLEQNNNQETERTKAMVGGSRIKKDLNYMNYQVEIPIITSRVHAAETPGSHVFHGLYQFLTSNSSEAKYLRKFYTFVLVPTLNPDGIVCGNYRSSVAGVDLNRQWIMPDHEFQPEIFAIKNCMKNMYEIEKRKLWIYCDLHGHSKKKNSFFYGCNTAANGGFLSWTIVRLLPRIFAKKTHFFSLKDCRFKVEPYKLGTARVVAWKQFQITHSFTLETSFYGYDFGEDSHKTFEQKDYQELGVKLCQSIFDLHFLWKSIRNELKLTNGWLKPRKLIEITGIPAAQLLNEEMQRKKKEDQKKKAIEIYEQFLKKFYNTFQSPQDGKKKLSKVLQIQNMHLKNEIPSSSLMNLQPITKQIKNPLILQQQNSQSNTIQIQEKSRNQTMNATYSETFSINNLNSQQKNPNIHQNSVDNIDYDDLYIRLMGLVKIQALIRGYLTRKRVIIPKIKIIQKTSRNEKSIYDSPQKGNNGQINGGFLNQQQNNLDGMIDNINWRQYFQVNELEEAFQVVEVDQIDDPNDEFSDGSSSNPSVDNLDLKDMYEKVYQVKNTKDYEDERKQYCLKFQQEIEDQEFIDQQRMLGIIEETLNPKKHLTQSSNQKLAKYPFVKQSSTIRQPIKNQKQSIIEQKMAYQMSIVSTNQIGEVQTPEKMQNRNYNINQNQEINANPQTKNSRKSPYQPQFYNAGINIDQQILKKSNTQSPIQRDEIINYPLTTHSIFEQKNSASKHSQQHHQHQHNYIQQTSSNQVQQRQSIQQYPQSIAQISTQQLKIFQAQQLSQHGRKENISQVIKDCFITKQIVNQNHQSSTNNGNSNDNDQQSNMRQKKEKQKSVKDSEAQKYQQLLQQQRQQTQSNFRQIQQKPIHQTQNNLSNELQNQQQQIQQQRLNLASQPQYNTQQIKFVHSQVKKGKSTIANDNSNNSKKIINKSPVLGPVQPQIDQRDQAQQFYINNNNNHTQVTFQQQLQQFQNHQTSQHQNQQQQIGHNNPTQGVQGISQEKKGMTSMQGFVFQQYINGEAENIQNFMKQDMPLIQGNGINESASSLFMRYVKQKLVKKIKTDQMPIQVADKYLDIYRELIEKEAQKRNQESIFQRNLNSNKIQGGARNKSQAKSEQKSRSKLKGNKSNILSAEKIDPNQQEQQVHFNSVMSGRASRQFHEQDQKQNHKKSLNKDEIIFKQPGEQQLLSYQSVSQSYNKQKQELGYNPNRSTYVQSHVEPVLYQSNIEGFPDNNWIYNSNVALTEPDQLNALKRGPIQTHQQQVNNLPAHQQTHQAQSQLQHHQQNDQNIKFPSINNFSSTLEYKKKSREAIKESKSIKNQFNTSQGTSATQPYDAYRQQNNFNDLNIQNPSLVANIQQPLYQEVTPYNIKEDKNFFIRNQSYAPSQQSIESSLDDQDMLDKIKNIYHEMRNTTNKNLTSYSKNQYQTNKSTRIGSLRQQRLLVNQNQVKGSNSAQTNNKDKNLIGQITNLKHQKQLIQSHQQQQSLINQQTNQNHLIPVSQLNFNSNDSSSNSNSLSNQGASINANKAQQKIQHSGQSQSQTTTTSINNKNLLQYQNQGPISSDRR
ncbi:zinc carboxypeptidase family protein [Stylonychia lemnae]|uniref:Zinc carboxypeptidase family protein n=1 Tax=Stylonychia lemnae TaxID=5949 RepID=A0A078A020_STYLE|nr:zinc carboxypeptidase family protein [Stylonychia lemnae]|eukprot:CDW74793.1 zinc carboxypeptidase family protein [Stylonychia lemnae]